MRKLLVADDEPDMLHTLEHLLEMTLPDCTIVTAADGAQAYDVAVRESPSVIVADFKMPSLDGFQLALRLEEAGRDTPIVLMTAFADSSLEDRAARFPLIRRFFKKPIDPPSLVTAIQDLLDEEGASTPHPGAGARLSRPSP